MLIDKHVVFYTTPDERKEAVDEQKARKWTMLHDDFNQGPNGEHRLTFTPGAFREFKAAWAKDEETMDWSTACELKLSRIREIRNYRLAALDTPWMIASEQKDEEAMSNIASQKQTLRDLPATVDFTDVQTVDELAALWPEELAK